MVLMFLSILLSLVIFLINMQLIRILKVLCMVLMRLHVVFIISLLLILVKMALRLFLVFCLLLLCLGDFMRDLQSVFSDRLNFLISIDSSDIKEISYYSGVSYHSLVDYTLGRRVAQARNLVLLSCYFNVTVDYLLGLSEAPECVSRHFLFS